jgi:hypothetical protein
MKQTAVEWLFEQVWITSGEDLPELLEQAKEMEKEQMCSFAEFVATYPDKNKNINDGAERTVDLLETFKSE